MSLGKSRKVIYNTRKLKYFLVLLLIVSIFAELYYMFIRIGVFFYINASRQGKSLLNRSNSFQKFYIYTIPLVTIISFQQAIKRKDKSYRWIVVLSMILSCFNAVIDGSSAELISIILPALFLLESHRIISEKWMIFFLSVSFILFGYWKSLYSVSRNYRLYFDSEFNSWYKIFINVYRSRNNFLFGKSYLETIYNLIIPITKTEPLSVWYVKTYEYSTWVRGGGRGFSGVLEAYLNFGIFGNLLIFGIYGWLAKKIEKMLYDGSDIYVIIYMIFLSSTYRIFRSESYSFWKTTMWYKIYLSIFMIWLSNRQKKQTNKPDLYSSCNAHMR